MTIKMYQVLEFQSFYEKIKDKKMSIKTTYKFSKLLSKLESEFSFYQSEFQKILNNYGEKEENGNFVLTDDGQGVKIKSNCMFDCQKEIKELHNIEINIDDISFTLEELESLEITMGEMNILMPFIKE